MPGCRNNRGSGPRESSSDCPITTKSNNVSLQRQRRTPVDAGLITATRRGKSERIYRGGPLEAPPKHPGRFRQPDHGGVGSSPVVDVERPRAKLGGSRSRRLGRLRRLMAAGVWSGEVCAALDLLDWLVAVHERGQVLNKPASVAASATESTRVWEVPRERVQPRRGVRTEGEDRRHVIECGGADRGNGKDARGVVRSLREVDLSA